MGSQEKEKKSKHRSKHKHKTKHRHHRHKKKKSSHHKKHKHIELDLEDKVLQNALDCLESGSLSTIKEGYEGTPQVIDNLVSNSIGKANVLSKWDDSSDDEDDDSLAMASEGEKEAAKETSESVGGRDAAGVVMEKLVDIEAPEKSGGSEVKASKWRSTFADVGEADGGGGAGSKQKGLDKRVGEAGGRGETAPSGKDGENTKAELMREKVGGLFTKVVGILDKSVAGSKEKCIDKMDGNEGAVKEAENGRDSSCDVRNVGKPSGEEKKSPCKSERKSWLSKLLEERLKEMDDDDEEEEEEEETGKAAMPVLHTTEADEASEVESERTASKIKDGKPQLEKSSSQLLLASYSSSDSDSMGHSPRPVGSKKQSSKQVTTVSTKERRKSKSINTSPVRIRNGRAKSRSVSPTRTRNRNRSRSKSTSPVKRSTRHKRTRSRSQSPVRTRNRTKSRSMSPARTRNRKRTKSRSVSPIRTKKRNRTRSKSPSEVRRRSGNRSRSKSTSPVRSRRRSKSPAMSRRKLRSRSRSRGRRGSKKRSRTRRVNRSRSQSRHGDSRKRSRSSTRTARHGRYERSGRRRSHSRTQSSSRSSSSNEGSSHRARSRRHSVRRSRSKSRQGHHKLFKSSSSSRSSSPTRSGYRSPRSKAGPTRVEVEHSITAIAKEFSNFMQTSQKKITISKLTNLCRNIQGDETSSESKVGGDTGGGVSIRAPFAVKPSTYQPGLVLHNNAWKTTNQIAAEANAVPDRRPLTDKFPVSAGLQHKVSGETDAVKSGGEGGGAGGAAGAAGAGGGGMGARGVGGAGTSSSVFGERKEVDINDLAVKRLLATERLKLNPADVGAHVILQHVEQQTKVWVESKIVPGKFTGQQTLSPLTREDHKTGIQAWAKKNMFHDLAPVMSGFGMKMLKKMGWDEGRPLGKEGVGQLEPLALDVKVNRTGLSTASDRKFPVLPGIPASLLAKAPMKAATPKAAHLVEGKHPVSALQEICSKKHWDPPSYDLVQSAGPSHKMTFLYEVTTPMGKFRASLASNTKKQAKLEAAKAALQGLGLLQKPEN